MKKTLLAAALLAGFAGAAQAQSSVTLYGIVDVGLGGGKVTGSKSTFGLTSGNQSGSRWGLRGSEDLGNGLRANFQLESGFDVGRGTQAQSSTASATNAASDRLFGRQAWGGLSGNWGEVRLGRQVTVSSDFFAFTDPFGTGFNQAAASTTFRANSTNRTDNTVAYFSPNISGFQAGVGYSFNQNGSGKVDSNTANKTFSGGLKYNNGPVGVAVTYEEVDYSDNATLGAGSDKKPQAIQVGGTYNFNVVKLFAAWSQQKNGFTNIGNVNNNNVSSYFPNGKANAYLLGLSAPIGNGSLFGSYQYLKFSGSAFNNVSSGDKKTDVISVGYTYDLSKRTNLYAYYSYQKNPVLSLDRSIKSHDYAVGMRHRF